MSSMKSPISETLATQESGGGISRPTPSPRSIAKPKSSPSPASLAPTQQPSTPADATASLQLSQRAAASRAGPSTNAAAVAAASKQKKKPVASPARKNSDGATSSEDEEVSEIQGYDMTHDVPDITSGGPIDSKHISWQCGACRYCILAMDQRGRPLPIRTDAWGAPIPLQCPRCLLTHTKWSSASPFDEYGDHVNVKGAFANSLIHSSKQRNDSVSAPQLAVLSPSSTLTLGEEVSSADAAAAALSAATASHPSVPLPLERLPPILASIGLVTYRNGEPTSTVKPAPPKPKQRQAYYCGHCNRRLLRMDQYGDLVPLDTVDGVIVPLQCPGCKETHSDWQTKPFR